MVKENLKRKSCVDVFNAFLVSDAEYSGKYEIPRIDGSSEVPEHLVVFSKATACKNPNSWIHFYEDDYQFERLWRNPEKYLALFKMYDGVILPDFSVYRDMPYVMQIWNIYRSRAIGNWLQKSNIKIIPNIRYGDCRTWKISCEGVSKGRTIAVGSHGTIKNVIDRKFFSEGLKYVVNNLNPHNIVVYGTVPDDIFNPYKDARINIVQFKSDYSIAHKGVE
jgi:hypothetical protein